MFRITAVLAALVLIAIGIGSFFWQQELKYQLPTPLPVNFKSVQRGSIIDASELPKSSAYFLHFYNPDCPCSRFNARHVRSIIQDYRDSIAFYIVVPDANALLKAKKEFENVSILIDPKGAIAAACGVYSTPQGVIIDANHTLYYRGNYNRSRYCTTRASNFAELSLIALLNHQPSPDFGLMASQAYGCELSAKENDNQLIFFLK